MKTVEEKLADYIEVLEALHAESDRDSRNKTLSDYSRTLATGELYVLKNVISKLKEIK